ncbi:sugar phosphate nucleotidyltransferase [Halobacteriaceae archaeon SHR40]|uniref:sugar phosphate nucleotidyltransferase n=1 Tax=Halovenus amylolytica TaxID=2500550 RepID=UPI000FE3DF26
MKAIIPTAGQGTRLYPHTHTKPKPMVRLAGRPILGHILESFTRTPVEEVVLVIGGPMKSQVVEYANSEYGTEFDFSFVEQASPEGLGHSIYQADPEISDEPVVIALGDMIFENGYSTFLEKDQSDRLDGLIGVKPVTEPQHYGVVDIDSDGIISSLVEKPDDPPSDLAISGVYIVHDSVALFDALDHLVSNGIRGAGNEYQLTDALQIMIDEGCQLGTFEVEEWYDCGRPDTLLEANRVCLDKVPISSDCDCQQSAIVEPVDIGENVDLSNCVIGPHVSIDDGARINNSIVQDSIVGRNSQLTNINIKSSIVGDNTEVVGNSQQLNVGDNSVVENL